MFDFDEILENGYLNEWYAIPIIVILIILKVFIEKKYDDSIKKKKK